MGTALVLLGTIAAGMAGTAAMFRVVQNFQPGKQKIRKDYEEMQLELRTTRTELVPLQKDELELLSTNQINETRKKRIKSKASGVFVSIYQEPMIAWAMRKYRGSDRNALVIAQTSRHEFALRIKSKQTEISIDSKIGFILLPDGKLTDARGKNIYGYIGDNAVSSKSKLIFIGRREVASLQIIPESSTPYPRVFNYLVDEISEEERLFLLAITIGVLTQNLA